MKAVILALGLCFGVMGAATAHAQDVTILKVTTDAAEGILQMRLVVDANGTVTAFKYVGTAVQVFNASQLPAGVVVMNRSGKDVVKIVSRDFDARHGGTIDINYLKNGVDNSRGDFILNLVHDGGLVWHLERDDSAGRRKVTSMFMKARRLLAQVIGIASISVN